MFSRLLDNNEADVSSSSDEEIFALSTKNPSLFGILLDRYQSAFLRKAEYVIKDRDLAEDIVQDAFVKIYKYSDKFENKGEGSFKSWAYKVLMNTSFTYYERAKAKNAISLSDEIGDMISDTDEEEKQANREASDYITSVLRRMPDNFSYLLSEFFLKGKSQEEIAKENGLTVGAVKVRIFRAKEAFRQASNDI